MGKSMENFTEQKNTLGLYDPQFEHDACGIGAVVDIKGRKSHQTVDDALAIVERLEHRAARMPRARPATVWAFCCRSATSSSPRWPKN